MPLTDELCEQLDEIRQNGDCNMLDSNCVQKIASDREFFDLVVFIEENRHRWFPVLVEFNKWLEGRD